MLSAEVIDLFDLSGSRTFFKLVNLDCLI